LTETIINLENVNPTEFFGVNNGKLDILKKKFPLLKILSRGTQLKLSGSPEQVESAREKINLVVQYLQRNGHLTENYLEQMLGGDDAETVDNFVDRNPNEVLVFGPNGKTVRARTVNQKRMVHSTDKNDIVFAIGPAGTGKTYTAVALAVRALKNKMVKKIILTRPAVEAGENLGFLPGDLKEKIDPYLRPLYDALDDMIPADKLGYYMSTRTIENWKDRMITIMVTPLITCSARLPVYTLLIALVVPNRNVWWIFNMQGLALTGMYLFSLVSAVTVAFVMKYILKARERGYFIMELPVYRMPRWKNVGHSMYDRAKAFVLQAGKVIIAISVVLWVLKSYGPGDRFERIEKKYNQPEYAQMKTDDRQLAISSEKLESSYAGVLGHVIEPAIKPLGFDWKIGIALITSFVAREVFVGSMATIYSGDEEKIESVQQKMHAAKDPDGTPVFTAAVAFSLMMFYAFAMQCASTVAVVYRETKDWRWPAAQFAYMTVLAYVASFITYHLLK